MAMANPSSIDDFRIYTSIYKEFPAMFDCWRLFWDRASVISGLCGHARLSQPCLHLLLRHRVWHLAALGQGHGLGWASKMCVAPCRSMFFVGWTYCNIAVYLAPSKQSYVMKCQQHAPQTVQSKNLCPAISLPQRWERNGADVNRKPFFHPHI